MKNTNKKQLRKTGKYLIVILLILFLVGCQKDNTVKPIKETETTGNVGDNLFPDEISQTTVLDNITIQSMMTQTLENGEYYLAAEKVVVFKQNPVEGSFSYSPKDVKMTLSLTISEGESCLGAIDGHKVNYTVNLKTKSIADKKVEVWKGCDEKTDYEFDYTDDQLVDFAIGVYSTLKAKHK